MKIRLSPFAEKDLDESVEYFDKQKEGLGDEFVNEVVETFERIKENPTQFPKVHKDVRKAKTNSFSFNIFFTIQDAIAYILGVFHTSRNPKTMKTRYKSNK